MESIVGIKDISGNILQSVPLTEPCEHVEELMQSDHITLSWESDQSDILPIGAYIEYKGEKYSLLEPYSPVQNDELKFTYQPQFKSVLMSWGKIPFFMYTYSADNEIINREPDWELTDNPVNFMSVICKGIKNETGEEWTYSVDASLPASATLSFQSVDVFSALNSIANAFETEWWADKANKVLHLSKAEHGTPITLEVGVNINTPSVTNSKEGYYTRFYAFGSTRNIVQDYNGANVNNLVNKRLTLDPIKYPDGYKDIKPGLQKGEIFSKILIFDDIYPSSKLTISDVRVRLMWTIDESTGEKIQVGTDDDGNPIYDQYAIWYFRIPGFTFNNSFYGKDNPDGMRITGKELSAHFETGALQGREFELNYIDESKSGPVSSADGTSIVLSAGDYEIKFKEEGTYIIPSITALIPSDGDHVILFNIRMPQEYVNAAYTELEDAMDKEIARLSSDLNNYQFSSNPVVFYENNPGLSLGRKVTYVNGDYSYSTRVIKLVTKLDYENDCKQDITIGNDKIKGNTQEIKEEVASANKDINLLAVINDMTSSLQQSYQRTQKMMLEGFASIKDMWRFDPKNPDTIFSKYNVYTEKALSSKGLSLGDGSGGDGSATALYQLNDVAKNESGTDVLGAAPGKVLTYGEDGKWYAADAVGLDETALASYLTSNNYAKKSDIPSLSGYATEKWVLDKGYITSTALTGYATQSWVNTQLGGYATSSALKAVSDKLNDFLTGTDTDNVINKWKELEAFLAGFQETDTLAGTLTLKADKAIAISAGTGLSGGGDLSANRTLSLNTASATALGGIKVGNRLSIDANGVLSATYTYTLPTASDTVLGGVKVGTTLTISSGVLNLKATGTAGTYFKVTTDAYGRVTSGSNPTTLAGFGITDGVNAVTVNGAGNAVTSYSLSGHTLTLVKGTTFLTKAAFDDLFEKVNIGTSEQPTYAIKVKYGLYTDDFISSKGLNPGTGGSGGGSDYDRLDAWSDYTADKAGYVLSAGLGNDLNTRLKAVEVGGAMNVTTTGSGNVVTAVSKSGNVITVTKGITALTAHQSLANYVTLNTEQEILAVKTFKSAIKKKTATITRSVVTNDPSNDALIFGDVLDYIVIRGTSIRFQNTVAKSNIKFENDGEITASKFIKSGGTSSQFLKADGSVDSNTYLTTSSAASTYVTLSTAQTITGSKTFSQSINISDDANNNGYKQYGITILRFNGTSASLNSTILSANGGKIYFRPGGTINTSYEATLDANGKFTAPKLSINGGTSSQFLMADGSVDSNTYLTTSSAASTYVNKAGDTMTGRLIINGTAGDKPLIVRGIVGSNGSGSAAELYLQYGANNIIFLGNTGSYNISANGEYYSGRANKANMLNTARTLWGKSFNGTANVSGAIQIWGATSATPSITDEPRLEFAEAAGTQKVALVYSSYDSYRADAGIKVIGDQNTIWFECPNIYGALKGNANTATALQTARTINGTSFNGSANIVTSYWGTARNIKIGEVTKSVNGSANVEFTRNDMKVAAGAEVSYVGTTTANSWYRIASSPVGIANSTSIFSIEAVASGRHSNIILYAGISYGNTASASLNILGSSAYTNGQILKVRIVYNTTYSGNYAYLEVQAAGSISTTFYVKRVIGSGNWTLLSSLTAGSIPSGYLSKEITPYSGAMTNTGDVVSMGYLKTVINGNVIQIGSQNTSWAHFQSSLPFYFSTRINVNGHLYPHTNNSFTCGGTSNRWSNVYATAGNFSSYIDIGSIRLTYDSTNNAIKVSKTDGTAAGLYTEGFLSSKGLNAGSGTGGGTDYDRLDAWSDYAASKAGWVLSAGLGNDLNTRLKVVEQGGAMNVTTTGSGNAVTAVSKSGTTITVTKGATFSLSSHTHSYLPLAGGTITGALGKSNNYLFKPNGGDYRTKTATVTGAICISLPANVDNTMISMWIDVYNYVSKTSFSVHVGGYTYNNSTFVNAPFAMVYGATHKVRLTYNNGFKIYIGETNTTWSYPQVSVRDVVLGFGTTYTNWLNSWSVSFVTSFPATINAVFSEYAYTTLNKPSFSAITSKPTTLAGYGITDAVTIGTAQTITGQKTFSTGIIARQDNDFLAHSNEFNFAPSGFTGNIYINYRTAGGSNGSIADYHFRNGSGGYSNVIALSFKKNGGTVSQFLMADGSVATKVNNTGVNNIGWTSSSADALRIPTMNDLAYWNGRYNASSSNLQYCDRGRFGDIVTQTLSGLDSRYVNASGDTMTGKLTISHASQESMIVNSTGAQTYISINNNGTGKASFGWHNTAYGTFLYNGASAKYLGIKDDGTPHYQGNTLVHAANYTSIVTKLGTATIGSTAKPIYLNAGTPTALSATVGASNRPVYLNAGTITAASVSDAYLSWADTGISGGITPIDCAASSVHSANRLAFVKPAGIVIEKSTNSGSTWVDYGATNAEKVGLVSGIGYTLHLGGVSNGMSTAYQLRITLNATNMGIYTRARKLLINVSTNGVGGLQVKVEKAMKGSETTFATVGTYGLSGWSGWNSIPLSGSFGGSSTQTSNIAVYRFTFFCTSGTSTTTNASVSDLYLIGDTYWLYNSSMGRYGHLYSYNSSQEATFPAKVTATSFSGPLSGNATTATSLQTARTLWGQSFNGTANVSGAISGATTITASGTIKTTATGGFLSETGTGVWSYMRLKSGTQLWDIAVRDTHTNGALQFRYNGVDVGVGMVLNTNGNVGIGTTSPGYKLEVNGSVSVGGALTLSSGLSAQYSGSSWISMATRTNVIYGNQNASNSNAHALYRVKTYSGHAVAFGGLSNTVGFYGFYKSRIDAGTNGTDWSTVWDTTTGNVTHNKALILSTTGEVLKLTGTATKKIWLTGNTDSNWGQIEGLYTPVSNLGHNVLMNIAVGLGGLQLSSTNGTLMIIGQSEILAKGVLHNTTGMYSDGYVSSKGQNTSDARLKTDIKNFNATSIIKSLRPVSFKWNNLARKNNKVFDTDEVQYGLIAQEVKAVAPWAAVDNMFKDGYMGVRYEKFIPVIMKAQIETIDEVTDLKKRLSAVERENERLRKEIQILKAA